MGKNVIKNIRYFQECLKTKTGITHKKIHKNKKKNLHNKYNCVFEAAGIHRNSADDNVVVKTLSTNQFLW